MYIIAVDSGTTNLRMRLVNKDSNEIIDIIKCELGITKVSKGGNAEVLKEQISKDLQSLINKNKINKNEIKYIVASGMITSSLGLYEVPHLESPATIEEVGNASVIKVMKEFMDIPCIFIPGLRNSIKGGDKKEREIDSYDVMRGEEVESYGIMQQLNLKGRGVLILPGSHTKYVYIESNQIVSSISTLCGEMLYAISKDTILSASLDKKLIRDIDTEYLLNGFESTKRFGLTRSLYHIRLSDVFNKMDLNQRANYFVGAVLSSDIESFLQHDVNRLDWVVVGGGKTLKNAFIQILKHIKIDSIIELSDTQANLSTVIGAIQVAEVCINKNRMIKK